MPNADPRPFDAAWLVVAGIGVLAVGVGAAIVARVREGDAGSTSSNAALTDAGSAAFLRVLTQGVLDSELEYPHVNTRTMLYFHKAFSDARLLDISPTELAVSGRYFGEDVEPIRIGVTADGKLRLDDGRRRYLAAKMAGAHAILADVVLQDRDGDVRMERRAAVNLL